MTSATSCCARRASEYLDARVTEIPELAPVLVDVTVPGAAHRSYRCRLCGQAWEEFRIPRELQDDFRVVKVGWASSDAAPPAPPKAPASPQARQQAPDGRRASSRRALVFLALAACLFYALWLLPALDHGRAWVARWIVSGLLLALAVQTLVSILRSKRPARRE